VKRVTALGGFAVYQTCMSIHLAARKAAPTLRLLGIEDGLSLLTLQDTVTEGLPPGFLRPKAEEALYYYLDGTLGVAYGIFEGNRLCASALLRLPDPEHPNPDAKPRFPLVPEADWPCHAAFLENAMVHPDARGRGLQKTLLDIRLAHAAAAGMRWACAASHLHNQASWSNLLGAGLVLAGLIERDGQPLIGFATGLGLARVRSDPRDNRLVEALDKAQHLSALGDGFVGVRRDADGAVVYQRLAHVFAL
jgi:GNAT superfamily N-acetyltransferase